MVTSLMRALSGHLAVCLCDGVGHARGACVPSVTSSDLHSLMRCLPAMQHEYLELCHVMHGAHKLLTVEVVGSP